MKLTFRINYRTVWGESLCVLMEGNHGQAIPLSTRDGNEWQGTTEYMPEDDKAFVTYRYAVFAIADVYVRSWEPLPILFIREMSSRAII